MMVLDLDGFAIHTPHDPDDSGDDMGFIDESIPKDFTALFAESPV
jgi:hypothetical protein